MHLYNRMPTGYITLTITIKAQIGASYTDLLYSA